MPAEPLAVEPIHPVALHWQLPVIRQLIGLRRQSKLPHAILIELRTVVDSREFGWYLASALLCEDPEQAEPCGACQSCQLMSVNNYPDFSFTTLLYNEKTSKQNKDIKIDQIRRLIHQFALTRNRQAGKIALIYPAEKMNQSAANSLLKTLEEPSSGSILILLTHNAGRLPVTIRSRCQKWVLENPGEKDASDWLQQQGVETDQLRDYLAMAHNDAQLALQLHQQQFARQQQDFRQLLSQYLENQIDVVSMVRRLKVTQSDKLRLLLKTELRDRIHQTIQQQLSASVKARLKALVDLTKYHDRVLQTEDNNLNLLLQLEDVLISMKQIVK